MNRKHLESRTGVPAPAEGERSITGTSAKPLVKEVLWNLDGTSEVRVNSDEGQRTIKFPAI